MVLYHFTDMPTQNGIESSKNIDPGTQLSIDISMGCKRRIKETDDSDDDMDSTAPPSHDIFRARQQKKAR